MTRSLFSVFKLDFSEMDRELEKLRQLRDSFESLVAAGPVQLQRKHEDDLPSPRLRK